MIAKSFVIRYRQTDLLANWTFYHREYPCYLWDKLNVSHNGIGIIYSSSSEQH